MRIRIDVLFPFERGAFVPIVQHIANHNQLRLYVILVFQPNEEACKIPSAKLARAPPHYSFKPSYSYILQMMRLYYQTQINAHSYIFCSSQHPKNHIRMVAHKTHYTYIVHTRSRRHTYLQSCRAAPRPDMINVPLSSMFTNEPTSHVPRPTFTHCCHRCLAVLHTFMFYGEETAFVCDGQKKIEYYFLEISIVR